MKAIIQHNFTSGLGDFFCDVSTYLPIVKKLKESGYSVNLRISIRGNKYTNTSFFSLLFDDELLSLFDSIHESEETIRTLEVEGCGYYMSNHSPQSPGNHHFDIFFDVIPENFTYVNYDAQKAHYNNLFPEILPSLNKSILSEVELFNTSIPSDYSFLHIRTSDIIDNDKTRYERIIKNVKNYIEETNTIFHLGTNNKFIYDELKKNENIYVYDFENYDLVNNDMNAFTNYYATKNFDSSVLIKRLQNICVEMVSVKSANKIYYLHDVNWISNFLFYSVCYNKNKIQLVNKNIWQK